MAAPANVFAFTPCESDYPEYLMLDVVDGGLRLTIRGPRKPAGTSDIPFVMPGDTARMTLPPDQVKKLYRALFAHVAGTPVPELTKLP